MLDINYKDLYKEDPYNGFISCLISKSLEGPKLLNNYFHNIIKNLIYILISEAILLLGVSWGNAKGMLASVIILITALFLSRGLQNSKCYLYKIFRNECYKCYVEKQIKNRNKEKELINKVLKDCEVKSSSVNSLKDIIKRNISRYNVTENTIKTILFSLSSGWVVKIYTQYFGINVDELFALGNYNVELIILIVATIIALIVLIFEINKYPVRWKQFWSLEALRLLEYKIVV